MTGGDFMDWKTDWEMVQDSGKRLEVEVKRLAGVLSEIITKNPDNKRLEEFKDELELSKIYVSKYEPEGSRDRYIELYIPNQHSKLKVCKLRTYNMKQQLVIYFNSLRIIKQLMDMRKRILTEECFTMPGEPSSMKNDGMAKGIVKAIESFEFRIIYYALNAYD